jgi:hypothetical protein
VSSESKGRIAENWLKALIVLTVVLLIAAVIYFTVGYGEIPAVAEQSFIEERFAPQIEYLRGLAQNHPVHNISLKIDDGVEMAKRISEFESHEAEWKRRVEASDDLFDDPTILGAMVGIRSSRHMRTYRTIKRYDEPDDSWCVRKGSDEPDQPSVSVWFSGTGRLVKYKEHFFDDDGYKREYELVVDLDALDRE